MDDQITLISPGDASVLVVDDDRVVRRVANLILGGAGYRLYEAIDGEEALAALAAQHGNIDVVLTDVVMPRLNGVRLAREIEQRWTRPRILFMSAHPAHVLNAYGLDLVHAPLIQKPFPREFLLRKVAEVLRSPRSPGEDHPSPRRLEIERRTVGGHDTLRFG
jgi:two-component system cell cycle sensor histidine kinase/response regulator CckA